VSVKKIIAAGVIVIALIAAAAFFADHRRKSIDTGELDRQLALLDREHGERQRNLEGNLGELRILTENTITALEGAGAIVERTGDELQSAAANLRNAKSVLGNLAVQIHDLESELTNCRAGLYRIRGLLGMDAGENISGSR
jgi:chromosome segregation ATPase